MYYDKSLNKKIPGCFILINNKYIISFIKVLKAFKGLLSLEKSKDVKVKSITLIWKKVY